MKRATRLLAALAAISLVAVACGGSDDLHVEDPWARTSAGMQDAGAVYMTIEAGSDADRLIGVTVSSDIAAMAQIHETAMDSEGMMSMSEVGVIDIPADGSVSLEPGGYHIMMMQVAEPLVDGESFSLTLEFEGAGTKTIDVEVRDQ